MIRVVAGGDDLAAFPDTAYTDRYVKILFPRPGVAYPEPFDMDAVRAALPREQWPAAAHLHRARLRPRRGRADDRLRAPRRRRPGRAVGGRGAPRRPAAAARSRAAPTPPTPTADWHLLVGDESALPAIGAALRARAGRGAGARARRGRRARGRAAADLARPAGPALVPPRRRLGPTQLARRRWPRLTFPAGRVHAFVHGEAGLVRDVAPAPARRARRARATTCRCRATGGAATTRRASGSSRPPSGRATAAERARRGRGRVPGNRPRRTARCS